MTPITAPDTVVRTWRKEATRAMHASRLADDPHIVDVLRFVPRELGEAVALMSEALSHASGILLASVANATPGAPDDLRSLVDLVEAERVAVDNGCEGGVA